jgi:hypothetical protein
MGSADLKKPWVIGLLSIIPGLGMIVLGEVRKGIVAFIVTTIPFLAMLIPSETVAVTGFSIGIIAWGVQMSYAVTLARQQELNQSGTALPVREETLTPPTSGASAEQIELDKLRRTVKQYLQPDEYVKVALPGTLNMQPLGSTLLKLFLALFGGFPSNDKAKQIYFALTEDDFVLIEPERSGKPADLQRIPLNHVSLVDFIQGALTDTVVIDTGKSEPLRISVRSTLRQGTQQLAVTLRIRQGNQPETGVGEPIPSAAIRQDYRMKYPILYAAILGGVGGIIGAFVTPFVIILLILLLEAIGAEDLIAAIYQSLGIPQISFSDSLVTVLIIYCFIMFPVGGMLVGAIPGAITGWLQTSQDRERKQLPAILAGCVTTVILTFMFAAAMFTF